MAPGGNANGTEREGAVLVLRERDTRLQRAGGRQGTSRARGAPSRSNWPAATTQWPDLACAPGPRSSDVDSLLRGGGDDSQGAYHNFHRNRVSGLYEIHVLLHSL